MKPPAYDSALVKKTNKQLFLVITVLVTFLTSCSLIKSCLSVLFTIWLFGFILSRISSTRDEIGAGGGNVWMMSVIIHHFLHLACERRAGSPLYGYPFDARCTALWESSVSFTYQFPHYLPRSSIFHFTLFSSLSLCLSFSVSGFGSVFLPFCFSLSQTMDSWQ